MGSSFGTMRSSMWGRGPKAIVICQTVDVYLSIDIARKAQKSRSASGNSAILRHNAEDVANWQMPFGLYRNELS